MSTLGSSTARRCGHASVASASSDPCMRLDIRLLPLARITYSLSRLVSAIAVPSGVCVSPNTSQGFTASSSVDWPDENHE